MARDSNSAFRVEDPDLEGAPARRLFEEAEVALQRGDVDRAERLCRRAHSQETERAEYLALLAWIEAQRPENQNPVGRRQRIALLDHALTLDASCERAYFYRAQLHRALDNHPAAYRDFRSASRLSPRNVEAAREVRIYEMRGFRTASSPSIDPRKSTPSPGSTRATPQSFLNRLLKK